MLEKRKTLYVQMDHFNEVDPKVLSFDPQDLQHVLEMKYFAVRDYINASLPLFLRAILDDETTGTL